MKRPVRWLLVYSSLVGGAFILLLHVDLLGSSLGYSAAPGPAQHNNELNTDILQEYNISASMLLERQRARKRRLETSCNNIDRDQLTSLKPPELHSIYVDDVHKTLYCAVPKVATTNWKRVFLMLTGEMNVSRLELLQGADVHGSLQSKHLVRLSQFLPDEVKLRLDSYFKFLFVRDPFQRLVSAYKSKFMSGRNTYFQKRDGRRIVRKFRVNPLSESLERGHDVSFNEFVQYLIDPRSPRPFNEHWRPYQQLCKPCQIDYDVIGKYETLEEDVLHVISAMSASSRRHIAVRFPAVRRTNRTADLASRLASVATDDVRRLCTVYAADLNIFGYACPVS